MLLLQQRVDKAAMQIFRVQKKLGVCFFTSKHYFCHRFNYNFARDGGVMGEDKRLIHSPLRLRLLME